jgi:hypothetical protein
MRRDWSALHKSWLDSGFSVSKFCSEKGLSISGFYGGMKRNGIMVTSPPRKKVFSKARLVGSSLSGFTAELPNGVKMTFDSFNLELIQNLAQIPGS